MLGCLAACATVAAAVVSVVTSIILASAGVRGCGDVMGGAAAHCHELIGSFHVLPMREYFSMVPNGYMVEVFRGRWGSC